jgi:hypothetical protein
MLQIKVVDHKHAECNKFWASIPHNETKTNVQKLLTCELQLKNSIVTYSIADTNSDVACISITVLPAVLSVYLVTHS